jgi:hypothetical protein
MYSNMNTKILATIFVAMTTLGAVTVASAGGIAMIAPAFAQGDNMTDGGNVTDGNMTGSDTAGSGMATPPMIPP